MVKKDMSYEIINVSGSTNVKFYTSIDPGSYIPTHWHRAVEIIYMQEGSLDVTVESESFTIHEGDCILINGNVLHSTKCTAPNTAILLQIPLDFMEKYIPNLGQLIFLWDYQTEDPVKKTKLMMLKTTLEQLQVINDIRPDGYLLRFNSLIFELLFQLYHNFSVRVFPQDINHKKKEMDRLDPAKNNRRKGCIPFLLLFSYTLYYQYISIYFSASSLDRENSSIIFLIASSLLLQYIYG